MQAVVFGAITAELFPQFGRKILERPPGSEKIEIVAASKNRINVGKFLSRSAKMRRNSREERADAAGQSGPIGEGRAVRQRRGKNSSEVVDVAFQNPQCSNAGHSSIGLDRLRVAGNMVEGFEAADFNLAGARIARVGRAFVFHD